MGGDVNIYEWMVAAVFCGIFGRVVAIAVLHVLKRILEGR